MRNDVFGLLNNHVDVSHETFERLVAYHDLLLKWQKKINLVSNDTVGEGWQRHFLDSLQLLPYIGGESQTIMDLGSGAGFPGMVLAVAGCKNVHLVESDTRKVAFLREVARVTNTEVKIHNCRIEDVDLEKIDVVTSRACASLEKLFALVGNKVSHETICLFHKGKNYSIEHAEAQKEWQYHMLATPSIVDSSGVIMKISNLKKRGDDGKFN